MNAVGCDPASAALARGGAAQREDDADVVGAGLLGEAIEEHRLAHAGFCNQKDGSLAITDVSDQVGEDSAARCVQVKELTGSLG